MRRRTPWWLALLLFGGLSACKCESDKMFKAVGDFMDFSEGKDSAIDPYKPNVKKEYTLRRWKEEYVNNRHRALVDLEVPVQIGAVKLEKMLRDAIHDPGIQRSTSAVMVRAWPGKLERLAAPVGIAIFARDGHGWEGTGVGFEQIHVLLPDAKQRSARDLKPLNDDEYLILLGVENMLQRGMELQPAQEATAQRHEVPVEKIQAVCLRGAKLAQWLKARAQAQLNPVREDSNQ